jgi:hypothetical protein
MGLESLDPEEISSAHCDGVTEVHTMAWYPYTVTRSTWHVVDQVCDGKRALRSHRRKGDAVLDLQRHMSARASDGCHLLPIASDRLAVFRDGIPVGWIGYEQCSRRVCPGCDALESAS